MNSAQRRKLKRSKAKKLKDTLIKELQAKGLTILQIREALKQQG
jgi:hypothetical protein